LRYAETLRAVEQRIVDELPEIIDALIGRAKDGELKAAADLCNRVMGVAAGAKIVPADDRQPPYCRSAEVMPEIGEPGSSIPASCAVRERAAVPREVGTSDKGSYTTPPVSQRRNGSAGKAASRSRPSTSAQPARSSSGRASRA
jgi:hypothetical protein